MGLKVFISIHCRPVGLSFPGALGMWIDFTYSSIR